MPDLLQQTIEYVRDLPTWVKSIFLTLAVIIEYVFPLFPGDTFVLFAGFLNAYQALELLEISISIVVGTVIGASLAYGFGRLLASHKEKSRFLMRMVNSENWRKFDRWYQKWGIWFLLLNRFFPGIRSLFFVAAGMQKISVAKVLILGGLSAILFNACLILLGYVVGFNAELIFLYFYRFNMIAIILIFTFLLVICFFLWKKKR